MNPLPPAAKWLAMHSSRFDHQALANGTHDSSPPVSIASHTVPTAASLAAAGSHASNGLCASGDDFPPSCRLDIHRVTTECRSVSLKRAAKLKVDGALGGTVR